MESLGSLVFVWIPSNSERNVYSQFSSDDFRLEGGRCLRQEGATRTQEEAAVLICLDPDRESDDAGRSAALRETPIAADLQGKAIAQSRSDTGHLEVIKVAPRI